MKKVTTLLFDYDGVFIDSFANCFRAYQLICDFLRHPRFSSLDEFKSWYEVEWTKNLERLGADQKDVVPINKLYMRVMREGVAPFYDGIDDVVRFSAQHFKQGLVSGGYKKDIIPRLTARGLLQYFPVLIDNDDMRGCIKPHPYGAQLALQELKSTSDETASIGDTSVDVLTAHHAGISHIISVTYGWETRDDIERKLQPSGVQPLIYVDSPQALLEHLKTLV